MNRELTKHPAPPDTNAHIHTWKHLCAATTVIYCNNPQLLRLEGGVGGGCGCVLQCWMHVQILASNFWIISLISVPSSCSRCLCVTKPEFPRDPSTTDLNIGQWPQKGKLKDETLQGVCACLCVVVCVCEKREGDVKTNRGRKTDQRCCVIEVWDRSLIAWMRV